ncbi:MAG TPA: hypothetical protein VN514_01205 [Ignavibacteria bacterium]|nr:hypothetical protein [Ignavibacteria bacterium]
MIGKTNYNLIAVMVLMIFSGPFVLYSQPININSDRNISNKKTHIESVKNNSSKFSIALLPSVFIPIDHLKIHYSTGYGFAVKTSYEITEGIFVTGGFEMMLSQFKMSDWLDGRNDYENTSRWYSFEIGMRALSSGKYGVFWGFNISATQIYHGTGNIHIGILNNPDNAIGFNTGPGVVLPVSSNLALEINPSFNIIYRIDERSTIGDSDSYYKISMGLNYRL